LYGTAVQSETRTFCAPIRSGGLFKGKCAKQGDMAGRGAKQCQPNLAKYRRKSGADEDKINLSVGGGEGKEEEREREKQISKSQKFGHPRHKSKWLTAVRI